MLSNSDFTIFIFTKSLFSFPFAFFQILIISLFNQAALDYTVCILSASLCGSLMKVISDEDTGWLSLSDDGERVFCTAALPSLPPRTDLLFQENRDAKWTSCVSAAWNPFAA